MPKWIEYRPETLEELYERDSTPENFDRYALVKYNWGSMYAVREMGDDNLLGAEALVKDFLQWVEGTAENYEPPLDDMAAGTPHKITIYTRGQRPFGAACWAYYGFYTTRNGSLLN